MHKLAQWTVKRSGANVVVTGINEAGVLEKFQAIEVAGPDQTRVALPHHTVAWQRNGDPVLLVNDFLDAGR